MVENRKQNSMLKPCFEKGSILKQHMLEALRDLPFTICDLFLNEYGDGIIEGLKLTISDTNIMISPGIFKYNGELFFFDHTSTVPLKDNHNNFVYLVPSDKEIDGGTDVLINIENFTEEQKDKFEIFRCTKGENAKISPYATFMELLRITCNRLNQINTAFSYRGGSSLSREYFKLYAYEIMQSNNASLRDLAFAMQCLNGINDISIVNNYFGISNEASSNIQIIEQMKIKLLNINSNEKVISNPKPTKNKGIIEID